MGAHNIEGVLVGQNLWDAYRRAVEDAQYEYGHDGYNGTISTTHGTKTFRGQLPEGFREAVSTPWGDRTPEQREMINKVEDAALDQSEKWGPVVVVEIDPDEKGNRRWLYFGWAAS